MKVRILAAMVAATVCFAPAHAEYAPLTPGAGISLQHPIQDVRFDGMNGRKVDPSEASETYRNALVAADCIIGLGNRAARVLAEESEPAIGKQIYSRYRTCARQPNAALRVMIDGAVAEQLLRNENAVAIPARAPHVDVDQAARFHGDLSADHVSLTNVARCAVVYSPGLAHDVLRTEVGSDVEEESLATLFASTPECGLNAAPTAVPSPVQRSAIAVALYRWAHPNA